VNVVAVKWLFLGGNVLFGLLMLVSFLSVVVSGYDEKIYQATGEIVPLWSSDVKANALIGCIFSIGVVVGAVAVWFRNSRLWNYIFAFSIFYFFERAFSEWLAACLFYESAFVSSIYWFGFALGWLLISVRIIVFREALRRVTVSD